MLIGVLLVVSCASRPQSAHTSDRGAGYMTASWYGEKFHGRPTSSGERYDMYGLTAAHKTMKFGTKLRVTNPETNESVVVTVNDRGPFIRGRDLDLSYGAAKAIGHVEKGVGTVKVEEVGRDMRYVKRIPYLPPGASVLLTIQVGSFIESSNAYRLKQGLEYKYDDVHVTEVALKGKKYHRVRIGKFKTYDSAYTVAESLSDEGYTTLIMRRN